ncbi:type II secretion system minor pseudopilin GspJ [Endozoicomonas arenosclerae]|uniref:type II secretion system minor pseudopilin GspJ n=1 Tax=Endozoicomonas arenosclerae TaxID=1633495 RepID=UPI0007842B69|nr:type II secretion system minor pseudopilin GspJ [Endozoicomonas arenosclerae]
MTRSRHRGFTLLEVLAALTIFALVSLSAWQILQGVMSARDVSSDHQNRIQEIDYAMIVMEQDFRQMIDRGVRVDGELTDQSLFAGEDMLESDDEAAAFIRLGWRNPQQKLPRSELQKVSYRLKDGVLERQHFYVLDPEENAEPVVRDLLTDVRSLKFQYFINGKWVESVGKTLPQGLMITFELNDLGVIERRFVLPGSWEVEEEAS